MRTLTFFYMAALFCGLAVRAAEDRFGDPGALINPIDTTEIKKDVKAGIRFGGFVVDAADAAVTLNTQARNFIRGTLDDSFFKIQEADPPTLRAVKTFLGELRGVMVACKGRVVIKLPLRLDRIEEVYKGYDGFIKQKIIEKRKVAWLNDRHPVSGSGLWLTVGVASDRSAEEAESLGESIIYTFQLSLMDPRVLEAEQDDASTERVRWTSLNGALDGFTKIPWLAEWQCSVRLRRRPARIEEVLPQPPTVEVLSRLPFGNINCMGIPRMSNLSNIIQEVMVLTNAQEQSRYLIARSKQGEVDALCALGRLYWLNEHRRSDALRTLEEAALLGSGEAAWELAERYANADGVERDAAKAVRFYTIAADEGYRGASKRIEALRAAPAAPDKPSPAER